MSMKITEKLKVVLKSVLSIQMGEVKTDKLVMTFDAEELAEGLEVFTTDENGEIIPVADGEYTAEDGRIIVVAEGKVTEIRVVEKPAEEEVKVEGEIIEIDTPAEDPVEEIVEEVIDVKELKAKMDEIAGALGEILNSVKALEGRIEEVENKVSKLEVEPAEDPVEVEVEEPVKMSRMAFLKK